MLLPGAHGTCYCLLLSTGDVPEQNKAQRTQHLFNHGPGTEEEDGWRGEACWYPPDSFSVTGLLLIVKTGSKRMQAKKQSLNSWFFQSASDWEAMIWDRAATRYVFNIA